VFDTMIINAFYYADVV